MKMLDFSPRPGADQNDARTYKPGLDLSELGFAEQFLVWATRANHIERSRNEGSIAPLRLESAFVALDTPDALPLLREFLGLLEIEFGRPLTAPCFKWRSLMADEARVLTFLASFQSTSNGTDTQRLTLPALLLQTGQRLALALTLAGLVLNPEDHDLKAAHWPTGMPVLH